MREGWLAGLHAVLAKRKYASGGVVNRRDHDDRVPPTPRTSRDDTPAFLSPGRSTNLRPGESILEATERLVDGRDL